MTSNKPITVERRAVKIASKIMRATGLCRYGDVRKCRRLYVTESTCDKCIEKWLLTKAKKELEYERMDLS